MSLHSWGFKGPTKRLHLALFSVTEVLQLTKMFYRNNSVVGKEPGTFPPGCWWWAQKREGSRINYYFCHQWQLFISPSVLLQFPIYFVVTEESVIMYDTPFNQMPLHILSAILLTWNNVSLRESNSKIPGNLGIPLFPVVDACSTPSPVRSIPMYVGRCLTWSDLVRCYSKEPVSTSP